MKFADLPLHPALQRALEARGYLTATPVQAAVLDAGAAGRDLLVSSQTGSGKTIAFGAALVQTLLGEDSAKPRKEKRPLALVIVPTRELAAQVREELGWLVEGTGLRLAAFAGGTAVSGDLRALHRGVEIVIGTPGRLVDLVRREKLDLAEVAALVLDEADQMLDLGFREDLEILLKAAPATRRTLLLSATLPAEIRSLAKRFQRDALAIDTAGAAGGRSAQAAHDDITYVAHLIAGGDRLAAVVNVLRASEGARAIVFCTRRDAVGELHHALLARGFAATAISGDRAQAERDRALEQVRSGEARILVATNVAARGLHLPDVDLIVHADLPLNAESLTHRSGRTGRAGRKGTAVVIASLAERRKAERLLAAAHVRPSWTAPPSAKTIAASVRTHFVESLLAQGEAGAGAQAGADGASGEIEGGGADARGRAEAEAAADEVVRQLEGKLPAEQLLRRLLVRELARLPGGERLLPITLPSAGGARSGDDDAHARRRSPAELSRDGVLFRINLGGKDQADPRWMLPLICRRGGVTRREVGAIRIGPEETLFEIAGDAARDFALAASQKDPRAPHVRVERVDGGGDAPPVRPGGGARPPRGAHARGEDRRPLARPTAPPEGSPARGFGAAPERSPAAPTAAALGAAPAPPPGKASARAFGAVPARPPGKAPARGFGAAAARPPGKAPARGFGAAAARPPAGAPPRWSKVLPAGPSEGPAARPSGGPHARVTGGPHARVTGGPHARPIGAPHARPSGAGHPRPPHGGAARAGDRPQGGLRPFRAKGKPKGK
jgi:ATP-dependent RNA helicase DeaD